MSKFLITVLCCFFFMSSSSFAVDNVKGTPAWAAYSGEAAWTDFTVYGTLIFSPTKHPQLRPLKGWGKTIFARLVFSSLAQKDILAQDVYSLSEVENQDAIRRIIERDIPTIVRKGFDGILLDMDHREKDLQLADKITMLMNLLTEHYPYLRVMISVSYAHLSNELAAADDVLVNFSADDADISPENIGVTIGKLLEFTENNSGKGLFVLILGDAPTPEACVPFINANISCFSSDYQWSSLPNKAQTP